MAKLLINRHGDKEEFDDRKLYASVYYPARETEYSEPEAEELAEEVCEKVVDWAKQHEDGVVTSKEVRQFVVDELEARDAGVAFMYESYLDLS